MVASGFQDVSRDNGLGKGLGYSQIQEGQSDPLLWLVPDVYCMWWDRVPAKPQAIILVGITESWAVQQVGKVA